MLGVGGGTYDFNFCTFANYTPSFRRETSSLTFTNEFETTTGIVKRPTSVSLRNSIVWGSYEDELFFKNSGDPTFPTPTVLNSLLRTKEYQATTDATGKPGLAATGRNNLVNVDPLFLKTSLISSTPDYRLQDTSPAAAPRHAPAAGSTVPGSDLLNLTRNQNMPTIGAYEHR